MNSGDDQVHYGVRVRNEGPVRIIALDRPSRRNALDLEIRPVLSGLLRTADADRAVRAIVVTGTNGTFCAGGDVKDMKRQSPELIRPRLVAAQDIVRAIAGGSTPVVAAVEGAAFGAGLGLALACDRVIAGDSARLSASFTGVGFAADLGMTWSLPQRVGPARARQMLMGGDPVDAHAALAMGLVDDVVPAGEAFAAALRDAARWADGPPRALTLIKQAFAAPAGDLHAALDHEIEMQAELSDTDDYAEGIAAFHQRRPPRFVGA
jgi:2-(1,2-epoxy-1,2-dihydrophenyl)acetyl-CoA isomerase